MAEEATQTDTLDDATGETGQVVRLETGGETEEAEQRLTRADGTDAETGETAQEDEDTTSTREEAEDEDTTEETQAGEAEETAEEAAERKRRNTLAYEQRRREQAEAEAQRLREQLEDREKRRSDDDQPDTYGEDAVDRQRTREEIELGIGPRPRDFDFEDRYAYEDALYDWRMKKQDATRAHRDQEVKAQEAQKKEAERIKTNFSKFQVSEEELKKRLGDDRAKSYDEDTDQLTAFMIDGNQYRNPVFADALFSAGPEVAWEYAKDLERTRELMTKPPAEIWRDVGRVEARIESRRRSIGRPVRNRETVSEPERTLPSSSGAPATPDLDRMDGREYRMMRNKQDGRA